MANDDLTSWLKASAENKITSKNAWQSTLIEHFVDTNKFSASNGVNFQRASSVLEGCMKVYSTRVDDVSENTLKLLEIFNKDEEVKKKSAYKKKNNFIEKNIANINLKDKEALDFYDPLFSSILLKSEEYFLIDLLENTNLGMVVYNNKSSNIVMEDEKIDLEIEQLPVCDSLKNFDIKTQHIDYIDHQNYQQFDDQTFDNEPSFEMNDYEPNNNDFEDLKDDIGAVETVTSNVTVFQETPFGYFKGWAGPSQWKIKIGNKSKKEVEKKPKQKLFFDFKANYDFNALSSKSDTVLTKQAIIERRKNKNFLPEDYSYEIKDLYRFLKLDGYFVNTGKQENITRNNVDNYDDFDLDYNYTNANNNDLDTNNNNVIVDNIDFTTQFENSLILNDKLNETAQIQLKFTRIPKRVDIKKLKDNVLNLLTQNCNKFSQILNLIPNSYTPKESKDISPHFCLISLLHLANENEFEIKSVDNDLIINKFI